MAMLITEHRK